MAGHRPPLEAQLAVGPVRVLVEGLTGAGLAAAPMTAQLERALEGIWVFGIWVLRFVLSVLCFVHLF